MLMVSKLREMRIFTGSASPVFAEKVCTELGIELGKSEFYRFSDGEIGLTIEESVRGADVYVIQSTCAPVNDHFMELLIMIDTLCRASAYRVNVVTPYFGYARQDRKSRARDPITAKLVANLVSTAGADRVIAADLHAGQIQGFFDIPVDHLMGAPLLARYFREKLGIENSDNVTVVSPDIGGVSRARQFASLLHAELAIVDKRRLVEVQNQCEVFEVIGKVRGRIAIMLDDIIDTAGTIVKAADALMSRGALKVYACATHAVLSGHAVEKINASAIEEVVFTDTIPLSDDKKSDKITVLSIGPLFAEAIDRIHADHSVSVLFRQ